MVLMKVVSCGFTSFVPLLPYHIFSYLCARVPQFLCGPVLSAGQDTACAGAALGCWLAIVCVYCLAGRSETASGEVMLVFSSFGGREDSFLLCFSFLGRKYISVLHFLSSCV